MLDTVYRELYYSTMPDSGKKRKHCHMCGSTLLPETSHSTENSTGRVTILYLL